MRKYNARSGHEGNEDWTEHDEGLPTEDDLSKHMNQDTEWQTRMEERGRKRVLSVVTQDKLMNFALKSLCILFRAKMEHCTV